MYRFNPFELNRRKTRNRTDSLGCNKFSDNLQNCTIRGRRYKPRTIPTDLETIPNLPGNNRGHGGTVSRHSFHAQYPRSARRNDNSTAFLLFPRTRNSLYRCELHIRVHGLPRKRSSCLFFSDNGVARGRASRFQEIYRPTFRLYDLSYALFPGKAPRLVSRRGLREENEISRCCLNWQRNSPMNRSGSVLSRYGETWPRFKSIYDIF